MEIFYMSYVAQGISFLRDIPLLTSSVESSMSSSGCRDVAGLVAAYMVTQQNPFGAADWRKHFNNINVGPEISFGNELDRFWQGLDPVDVFEQVPNPRYVWETHLRPVFGFESYTDLQNITHVRSLDTLDRLGLKFSFEPAVLRENRNKPAGPACWLVMRKDFLARGESWSDQQQFLKRVNAATGAGYEESLSAIDLGTVLLPSIVEGNKYHFGNGSGDGRDWIFSRSKEVVKYENTEYPAIFGSGPNGVLFYQVSQGDTNNSIAVAAMRKFRP